MKKSSHITQSGRILIVLLLLLGSITACSSFKVYKLPNGVGVLALRDLERVYPIFASTFKAELDLALKTKAEISEISLGGKYEKDVKQLYENLDNLNKDVRDHLVTAYSKYVTALSVATTPDERAKASEAFDKVQLQVSQFATEVRKLNAQAAAVQTKTSATEWDKLFEQGKTIVEETNRAGIKRAQ